MKAEKSQPTILYDEFFHLFLDSSVVNLRDCLLEWLHKAKATIGKDDMKDFLREVEDASPNLLPGEIVNSKHSIDAVSWCLDVGKAQAVTPSPGSMKITNYRYSHLTSVTTSIRQALCVFNVIQ